MPEPRLHAFERLDAARSAHEVSSCLQAIGPLSSGREYKLAIAALGHAHLLERGFALLEDFMRRTDLHVGEAAYRAHRALLTACRNAGDAPRAAAVHAQMKRLGLEAFEAVATVQVRARTEEERCLCGMPAHTCKAARWP